jgi:hypothetical protein
MPSGGVSLDGHQIAGSVIVDFDANTLQLFLIDPPLSSGTDAGAVVRFDTGTVYEYHDLGYFLNTETMDHVVPFRFLTGSVPVEFP